MERLKVIAGNTIEDQIRSIDKLLDHRQKKDFTRKLAVAPPSTPISACPSSVVPGQELIRFLFPMSGTITKGFSQMTGARKIDINISLKTPTGGRSAVIILGDGLREEEVNLDVAAGSLLTVTLISADKVVDDEYLNIDLSFALLFVGSMGKAAIKQIAADQLGI